MSPTATHCCLRCAVALALLAGASPVAADGSPPPLEITAVQGRLLLSWRLSEQHLLFADSVRARHLGVDPAEAEVATRVGLEWMSARPRLGLQQGALGVQLESGYRMSLRTRHGGLAVYLRGKF